MSTHTAANPAPAVKRKSALKIISATVTLFLTLAVKGVSSFSIVPKIDLTRKNNTAPAKIDKLMTPKYALYVMLMGWSSNAACTAGMSEWMFLGTEPRLTENIDALPISSVVETYPAASASLIMSSNFLPCAKTHTPVIKQATAATRQTINMTPDTFLPTRQLFLIFAIFTFSSFIILFSLNC